MIKRSFSQQGRFTSDAAHELRTPVAVILTQAQMALALERSPAEYRETLETIKGATQRMRMLIGSLLELALGFRQGNPFPRTVSSPGVGGRGSGNVGSGGGLARNLPGGAAGGSPVRGRRRACYPGADQPARQRDGLKRRGARRAACHEAGADVGRVFLPQHRAGDCRGGFAASR